MSSGTGGGNILEVHVKWFWLDKTHVHGKVRDDCTGAKESEGGTRQKTAHVRHSKAWLIDGSIFGK